MLIGLCPGCKSSRSQTASSFWPGSPSSTPSQPGYSPRGPRNARTRAAGGRPATRGRHRATATHRACRRGRERSGRPGRGGRARTRRRWPGLPRRRWREESAQKMPPAAVGRSFVPPDKVDRVAVRVVPCAPALCHSHDAQDAHAHDPAVSKKKRKKISARLFVFFSLINQSW